MRRYIIFIFLSIIMTLGSGCSDNWRVQSEIELKVHKDGSGVYQVTVLTNPIIASLTGSFKQRLVAQNFQIQEIQIGEREGWRAKKKVKNILKEPPPVALPTSTESQDWKNAVNMQEGLFFNHLAIRYNLDLTKIDQELPLKDFSKFFYDRVDLQLKLSLPIKAKSHNAAKVMDQGKTLIWDLELGKVNPLHLNVDIPNPSGWYWVGGISIAIILFVLIVLFMFKRKRKNPLRSK